MTFASGGTHGDCTSHLPGDSRGSNQIAEGKTECEQFGFEIEITVYEDNEDVDIVLHANDEIIRNLNKNIKVLEITVETLRLENTKIPKMIDKIKDLEITISKLREETAHMIDKIKDLEITLSKLREETAQIPKKNEKITDLELSVCKLREKNANIVTKVTQEQLDKQVEKILKPLLTKTQIQVLLENKTVRYWPEDDIGQAITLRSISPKCYKYLRDVRGFPLPSKTTLYRRALKFKCEPGLLDAVLQLMKYNSGNYTEAERICVLSFDEMSLHKHWSFDERMDILYKPHEKVQVIMLRGLTMSWKQPVYFDYDKPDVHDILPEMILQIEEAGYPVVAIVHDMGPTNMRTWKKFEIDPINSSTCFKNPHANRNIYVFC